MKAPLQSPLAPLTPKSEARWKWMIGSAAATGAVVVPTATADRVQVTLVNNQVSLADGKS